MATREFTHDNTEGYTDAELAELNERWPHVLANAGLSQDSIDSGELGAIDALSEAELARIDDRRAKKNRVPREPNEDLLGMTLADLERVDRKLTDEILRVINLARAMEDQDVGDIEEFNANDVLSIRVDAGAAGDEAMVRICQRWEDTQECLEFARRDLRVRNEKIARMANRSD